MQNLDKNQGFFYQSPQFCDCEYIYHDTLWYGPAIYTADIVLNCNYIPVKQGNGNIHLGNKILFKYLKTHKKSVLYCGLDIFLSKSIKYSIFPIQLVILDTNIFAVFQLVFKNIMVSQ